MCWPSNLNYTPLLRTKRTAPDWTSELYLRAVTVQLYTCMIQVTVHVHPAVVLQIIPIDLYSIWLRVFSKRSLILQWKLFIFWVVVNLFCLISFLWSYPTLQSHPCAICVKLYIFILFHWFWFHSWIVVNPEFFHEMSRV